MIKIHQIISQKTKMCRGKEDEILDDEIISIDDNNDGVIDITYSSDNTIDLIDYGNDNDLNINHNDESYSSDIEMKIYSTIPYISKFNHQQLKLSI